MQQQDKKRLVAVLLRLQAVFPKDINEHTYEAYYEALKNWRIKYIEKAGVYFIRHNTFFPLPKDFEEYLLKETGGFESIESHMKEETKKLPEYTSESARVQGVVDGVTNGASSRPTKGDIDAK